MVTIDSDQKHQGAQNGRNRSAKQMAKRSSIVVVGSINMDLVVRSARLPAAGETVMGDDLHQFSGGKGANQAVACSRMGAAVRLVGCVGEDPFGMSLLDSLKVDRIDTRFVNCSGARASGVALITVDASGQNSIVVSPGANTLVNRAYVRTCECAFDGADVVVLQLEIPLDGVLAAAEIAKKRGIRVILNPAPARALPTELLSMVDDIIPNQSELALLTGTKDVGEGIGVLQERGLSRVVVTLGSEGAIFADKMGRREFASHKVKVIDTTAAGDSFVGAYAVCIAEGGDPATAVERGVAAGAVCVTALGAQASMPRRKAVDELLEKNLVSAA